MSQGDELLHALNPVVGALESLGVAYAIGGSVASAAHGEFRATNDIDLVAELGAEHVAPLIAALGDAYYVSEPAMRDAITRRASFNLIHLESMLKVDVFVSRGRPYDAESLRRRVLLPLSGGEPPATFHLASPEDTVLAKLDWFKSGGESSERQWRDILGVLRVQAHRIDEAYLRLWARELSVSELLERALGEASSALGGDD